VADKVKTKFGDDQVGEEEDLSEEEDEEDEDDEDFMQAS